MKFSILILAILIFACNPSPKKAAEPILKADTSSVIAVWYIADETTLSLIGGPAKRVVGPVQYGDTVSIPGETVIKIKLDTIYLIPTVDSLAFVVDSAKKPVLDYLGRPQHLLTFRHPLTRGKNYVRESGITFPNLK